MRASFQPQKPLQENPRVVHARVADIFVMQISDVLRRLGNLQLPAFVGRQETFEFIQIHVGLVCRGFLSNVTKRFV